MTVVAHPAADRNEGLPPQPELVTGFHLLRSFKPIESIVEGLPLPRGGAVSLTGAPGAGKTTVSALLQTSLVRGLPFAGREVTKGSVLVLAGENPDDYAMHLRSTLQDLGLYEADLNRPKPMGELLVIKGTFSIGYELDYLAGELEHRGIELVAVFVDTSPAFFQGENENDNTAMHSHAVMLRELTRLPGSPCVIALCHPAGKEPQKEALHPRGGTSFSGQLDGNLTLWLDRGTNVTTLHWCGKIRGQTFEPLAFQLATVQLDGITDSRGKTLSSSVARHVPDERVDQIQEKALDDGNRVLVAVLRNPEGSIADWAKAAGMTSGAMQPQKSRVSRLLAGLVQDGLVKKVRGTYRLTLEGRKEAERCRA